MSPYSQVQGVPVSPRTKATSRGNAGSARTSLASMHYAALALLHADPGIAGGVIVAALEEARTLRSLKDDDAEAGGESGMTPLLREVIPGRWETVWRC